MIIQLQLDVQSGGKSKPKRWTFWRRGGNEPYSIGAYLVSLNGVVLQSQRLPLRDADGAHGAVEGNPVKFEVLDSTTESLRVRLTAEGHAHKEGKPLASATLTLAELLPPGRLTWDAVVGLPWAPEADVDADLPPLSLRVAASRGPTPSTSGLLRAAGGSAEGSTPGSSSPSVVTARSSFSDGARSAASLHAVDVALDEDGSTTYDLMGGPPAPPGPRPGRTPPPALVVLPASPDAAAGALPPLPPPVPASGFVRTAAGPPARRPSGGEGQPSRRASGGEGQLGARRSFIRRLTEARSAPPEEPPGARRSFIRRVAGPAPPPAPPGAGAGARGGRAVGMGPADEFGLASFDPLLWEFAIDGAEGEGEPLGPHSTDEMLDLVLAAFFAREAPAAVVRQVFLPGLSLDPGLVLYPDWVPWFDVDFLRIRSLARSAPR